MKYFWCTVPLCIVYMTINLDWALFKTQPANFYYTQDLAI